MSTSKTLVWFSRDLRLADNPALYHAAERGVVVPVFIWAPGEEAPWEPGGARRWWLHHALAALADNLAEYDLQLIVRQGESVDVLETLLDETGADAVYWNTRYEPALRKRDTEIAEVLASADIETEAFPAYLLHDPEAIQTNNGTPYKVYTPYWRKLKAQLEVRDLLPVPDFTEAHVPESWPDSDDVDDLHLLPTIDWDSGFYDAWTPGEAGAQERLAHFLEAGLADYDTERNRPDHDGSSRLSPYLHHGELSPHQVWHAVQDWMDEHGKTDDAETYLKEVAWREFSYHLLYHFPDTPLEALKDKFSDFPWQHDDAALERWQKGQTGYPIVDAGMRQLWATGWMHNRVRMVVASFLTKDLLIWWQGGAKWFWDTLVDADLANNTMGWQWAAGSGADAQPFFRIFNPVSQGERYDPDGAYVRQWVPELKELPKKYIHKPWEAASDVLENANVRLGETYPQPMVDHSEARQAALEAYDTIR